MTTPELQLIYSEWEIIRLLGEGAFGKVYEIKRGEGELEEHAALKVIHIPQNESEIKLLQSEGADVSAHFEELARQLSNEIATQAKLKGNSNIVSYEDRKIVPDTDGIGQTILIRMELLTPLVDLMAAGTMVQAEVLRLGLDMAKALLLCERFHIIHRDIKPQNIFISPAGDYKLGDFGVARQLEQTTANLSRKGTYNYMAPEVFHGRPCNATVDIYSLGIVLYTLLNGNRAPFLPSSQTSSTVTSHDRDEAQTKRLSGEPLPPLPHVPAALNDVILRMCAFEPKERYQSARELMAALEGAAHELQGEKTVSLWGRTSSAAPPMDATTDDEGSRWIDGTPVVKEKIPKPAPAPIPEPVKKPKRKKTAIVLALVLVIAVVSGTITWLLRERGPGAVDVGGNRTSQGTKTDKQKGEYGEKEYPEGTYKGYFVDGKREGYGELTYKKAYPEMSFLLESYSIGDVFVGQWQNDQKEGLGTITRVNGATAEGTWQVGKLHGEYKSVSKNGHSITKGQFENGQLIGRYESYLGKALTRYIICEYDDNGYIRKYTRFYNDSSEVYMPEEYDDEGRIVKAKMEVRTFTVSIEIQYRANGTMLQMDYYVDNNDVEAHLIQQYDEKGESSRNETYDINGERIGYEVYQCQYHENGVVSQRENFRYEGSNLVSQYTTYFNEEGQLIRSEDFDADGKMTRYTIPQFNALGQWVRSDNYDADGKRRGYSVDLYNENDQRVRSESYDEDGRLSYYAISQYGADGLQSRRDSYDGAETLNSYGVRQSDGTWIDYHADGTPWN